MNHVKRLTDIIKTHSRDVNVIHSIFNKVYITIPMYYEQGMVLESARIENNEIIIIGKLSEVGRSKYDISKAEHRNT